MTYFNNNQEPQFIDYAEISRRAERERAAYLLSLSSQFFDWLSGSVKKMLDGLNNSHGKPA